MDLMYVTAMNKELNKYVSNITLDNQDDNTTKI
eukprot:CAMPEP_0116924104 /NCGR_PEP_ID=MMETSP0467-20121206/23294_1 /TAXON_ID=283647 /ORGANISM="Mesodinium pulex, Strain SPMC105" /LENGTH=32 /DNA_ID= /DNA_START= /DNA_END= /DNA_ORIENTATION=